ncbi:MAG TPA: hypothetical protein VME17_05290 [Bryobacteraceae bacterium]|nr:hypothetical protein [Bryobacteraceae bacterium]
MNLQEFNRQAIANDELIARLRLELAQALAARERLFAADVTVDEDPAREAASARV